MENRNNFINIFKGIIISIVITLMLLFLFSVILTYTNIGENVIPAVIIIATVISILIGSSISTIKIKKNGIINGGIIGLAYILGIYLISSIAQMGFGINVYSIIMIILSILAGMIGGIVGVNIKK
ncbi:MAG: TIGR04086 family membrane protein [Clostridia bacterium]|nr:TIGR04086 family membrane protein [Clostridia bacterium]